MIIILLWSTLGLAAAQSDSSPFGPPPAWEEAVRLGNAAIQETLIDPDSARIEWPYTLIGGTLTLPGKSPQTGWYTCGWVNAKNRMGGYVGRSRFLIMFQHGRPSVTEVGDYRSGGVAEATCSDIDAKGWLKSSGLEALGAMSPGLLPPTREASQKAYQTMADAGARQPGGMGLALLATPAGAVIMAISENSAAARAGLKVGQVIEAVGPIEIKGMPLEALAAVLAGQPKRLTLKVVGVGSVIVQRM